MKFLSMAAGAALLTLSGAALAEEPISLSDVELDQVSAGLSIADAVAKAGTFGVITAFGASEAGAFTLTEPDFALSKAGGVAITGGFLVSAESSASSFASVD